MTYTTVVFMDGDEADEVLDIIDRNGTRAALSYLTQWDYGDNYEAPRDEAPWGSRDDTEHFPFGDAGTYVLAWNRGLRYVSLTIMRPLDCSGHHSEDRVEVYTGRAKPRIMCGYHASQL